MSGPTAAQGARIIAVASGKGGAGKSTVTAGLGAALSRQGRRVLLIDADEGLRCLDLMLGVSDVVYDLGDVLGGRCTLEQAIRAVEGCPGLWLLAAPLHTGALGEDGALAALCGTQSEEFDYILIDSTAGLGPGFSAAAAAAKEVFVVVSPDPVCVRDAQRICGLLAGQKTAPRMVLNRYEKRTARKSGFPGLDAVIDQTGLQLLAVIPDDPDAARHAAAGRALQKGHAARAFDRLARRLEGENLPLPPLSRI